METAKVSDDSAMVEQLRESPYPHVIWNTIVAPSKAFASLSNKPRWLFPYILSILVVFTTLVLTNGVKMDDIKADIQSNTALNAQEIDRRIDNIEAQGTQGVSWANVRLAAFAVTAIQTIKLFAMVLIFWLAFHLVKAKISFKRILAVCSFSFLVLVPEAILMIPLIFSKGTTYIYLGPAVLLPVDWKYSPLFNLFDKLDIFSVWMVVLLVIGFSQVLEISKKKAAITVGYIWGIWLLLSMFVGDLVQIR